MRTRLSIMLLGLCVPAAMAQEAGSAAKYRLLSKLEATQLQQAAGVTHTTPSLKTATALTLRMKTETKQASARGNGVLSTSFDGLRSWPKQTGEQTPDQTAVPPATDVYQRFNFKCTADAAQGWAGMTPEGRPYLHAHAIGDAAAMVAASWRSTVTLAGTAKREIYVEFYRPVLRVNGVQEAQKPADWRSRASGELLVNGHPVWSFGATRLNEGKSGAANGEVIYLGNFGDRPALTDGPNAAAANADAPAQRVFISLGVFNSTVSLDLALLLRTEARGMGACEFIDFDPPDTKPPTACPAVPQDAFCTQGSAAFDWGTADVVNSPVAIWVRPI